MKRPVSVSLLLFLLEGEENPQEQHRVCDMEKGDGTGLRKINPNTYEFMQQPENNECNRYHP